MTTGAIKYILLLFLCFVFFESKAQNSNQDLLEKFSTEFSVEDYEEFITSQNLGTLEMDKIEVDSITVSSSELKFVKVPIYDSDTIRAAVIGVVNEQDEFDFVIVEIVGSVIVDMNFYRLDVGKFLNVHFEDYELISVNRFSVIYDNTGECIAGAYETCQTNCQQTRKCRASCAFWNDWFGGACNKAMWVGATAHCIAGLSAYACGGFN